MMIIIMIIVVGITITITISSSGAARRLSETQRGNGVGGKQVSELFLLLCNLHSLVVLHYVTVAVFYCSSFDRRRRTAGVLDKIISLSLYIYIYT